MRKLVRKAAAGQAIAPATTMQLDSSLLGLKNSLPGLMPTNQGNLQNITQGFNFSNFLNNIGSGLSSGQGLGQSIGSGLSSALQGSKLANSAASKFMSGTGGGLVTAGIDIATSLIPGKDYSDSKRAGVYNAATTAYNSIANGAAMIPGVGTLVSGVMKGAGLLNKGLDSLGLGTDKMTVADSLLDSPLGLFVSPLKFANAIGAKKSDTFEADEEANEQIGSSYSDSLAEFADAGDVSGKKYGLLSRRQLRKANDQIAEAQRQQDIMTDIAQEAEDAQLASNNPLLQNRLQISRTGGFQATAVGEKGMKLESNLYWARQLLSRMAKAQNTAQLYKDGGKMNIIPTGALHKELHHIDQDNITKKGIPVVTDNNGQIEQQAEIEKEEWILNAKQSNQIEELRDKYNASIDEQEKNQIAIEAGKIIVDELLYNTVDKGKLLKQVS